MGETASTCECPICAPCCFSHIEPENRTEDRTTFKRVKKINDGITVANLSRKPFGTGDIVLL